MSKKFNSKNIAESLVEQAFADVDKIEHLKDLDAKQKEIIVQLIEEGYWIGYDDGFISADDNWAVKNFD